MSSDLQFIEIMIYQKFTFSKIYKNYVRIPFKIFKFFIPSVLDEQSYQLMSFGNTKKDCYTSIFTFSLFVMTNFGAITVSYCTCAPALVVTFETNCVVTHFSENEVM